MLDTKREWWKAIDFVYLATKIGIWFFSAMISILPIVFMGIIELPKQDGDILKLSTLYNYILGSTDTIYTLVTMLTIVLADVLCGVFVDGKESKGLLLFCCLTHIITIISGILLYALYKTENVDCDTMIRINKVGFKIVFILSLVSYVNISTSKQRKGK